MPNAEMGEEEYQKTHKLDLITIPIFQAHSDKKDEEEVLESETIVVGTSTMNRPSYKETYKFAWAIQSMHLLGLLQIIAVIFRYHFGVRYCDFYKAIVKYGEDSTNTMIGKELQCVSNLIEGVFVGNGFDQYVPGFEDISWPPEEASYLRVSEDLDTFYKEIKSHVMDEYAFSKENEKLISDIIAYQKMRVVSFKKPSPASLSTSHNIHQFFEEARSGQLANLLDCQSAITIDCSKTYGNKKTFSREVVWYGRKGGKFFHNISEVL
jgi:hypothetical protein